MADQASIGGNGEFFVGEDKTLRIEVLDASEVPVDVSGWTLTLDVRRRDDAVAPAVLSKSATIIGTYNAVRTSNTQRVMVALAAADTASLVPTVYRFSLARLDSGNKTVLAWGNLTLQKATQP